MVNSDYPDRYVLYNSQQVKKPVVVVKIPGIDLLSSTAVYTRVRYGDPHVVYGAPGLVYGGLRIVTGVRDLLQMGEGGGGDISLTQKVEPEQGRASVAIIALSFLDYRGYMGAVCAPGVLIPELLGQPVTVYLGYQNTSYPEDYYLAFRAYITGYQVNPGQVRLQLSDPNTRRREKVFLVGKSTLSGPITNVATTIPITSTADFPAQILGPDLTYDTSIKTYLQIENEFIEYLPTGFTPTSVDATGGRGARGTTAVAHAAGVEVSTAVEITGNAMELALKAMLSGVGGPYLTGQSIINFVVTTDPVIGNVDSALVLPLGVDADRDLGLAPGDYLTITGAANAGNNVTCQVDSFDALDDQPNRIVYTTATFTPEIGSAAVMAMRSQWDTWPLTCGIGLPPTDVDVATHLLVRDRYLSQDILKGLITSDQVCKTFLESEIYLVEGAYGVTRFGRLSVQISKPPIADERLTFVDKDTVIDPDKITFNRALNTRRYYNEIDYSFDVLDDGQTYQSVTRVLDIDSLNRYGTTSVLPIKSALLKTSESANLIIQRRSRFLITRYKDAAYEVKISVNWKAGTLVETGDVIGIKDNGDLQIYNIDTGKRDIGTKLFEIIDRKLSVTQGKVDLTLLSGVGFDINDRYATISPSSLTDVGSTTTRVIIRDSYGGKNKKEPKKWADYIGQEITVHSYDWSVSGTTTLTGFDPANKMAMLVSPALSFTPAAGYVVDIAFYPTGTNPAEAEIYKVTHAFHSPSIPVITGISTTQFTVSAPDAAKFIVGLPVLIHNASYSILSAESKVLSVIGVTVTLETPIAFTPAAGQTVEGVGFPDGRGFYRII